MTGSSEGSSLASTPGSSSPGPRPAAARPRPRLAFSLAAVARCLFCTTTVRPACRRGGTSRRDEQHPRSAPCIVEELAFGGASSFGSRPEGDRAVEPARCSRSPRWEATAVAYGCTRPRGRGGGSDCRPADRDRSRARLRMTARVSGGVRGASVEEDRWDETNHGSQRGFHTVSNVLEITLYRFTMVKLFHSLSSQFHAKNMLLLMCQTI